MAAVAAAVISLAPVAHADPDYLKSPNDDKFIAALAGDGISMNRADGIMDAHAVCLLMAPSNGGTMGEAITQMGHRHTSWGTVQATHFVDRSIQNYCPQYRP